MSAKVVDDFELVEVEVKHHVSRSILTTTIDKRVVNKIFELAPVDQPGQLVMTGLVRQLPAQTSVLARIAEYRDRADHNAIYDARLFRLLPLLGAGVHRRLVLVPHHVLRGHAIP